MRDLELSRATTSQVTSVHLVFKPSGYATFYVDDAQGTLAVESDWGCWAYRWGRGSWIHPSHDLSAALRGQIGSDHDYVTRKLFGANDDEYNPEATRKAWRERLLEQRRCGRITRELAREAWDQIGEIDLDEPALAYQALDDLPELDRVLGDRCEIFERTMRRQFVLMRDVLLPAFVAELRRVDAGEALKKDGAGC